MYEDTIQLKEWLKESISAYEDTKALAKKTRDYANGDQLDKVVKRVLEARGQPELWENQIAKHNKAILGFKRKREVDIKVLGRQQEDKPVANVLNGVIKAITDINDYKVQSNELDSELIIEGVAIAYMSVVASGEFDQFGREHKDININQISYREMFLDPYSKSKNYNDDARYIHRCFYCDFDDLYLLGFDEDKIKKVVANSSNNVLAENSVSNDRKRVMLTYSWYRKYDKVDKQDKFYYCCQVQNKNVPKKA